MHYVGVVDNDVARRDRHAAVYHRWLVRPGQKADYGSMRLYDTDVNSRQILVSGVNPKLVHADKGQLGVEISRGPAAELMEDAARPQG